MAYVPAATAKLDAMVLSAARLATKIRLVWIVGSQDGKIMPNGVAVMSTAENSAADGDIEP